MATYSHQCDSLCRRFRGYGSPMTPEELSEFRRLRIEFKQEIFEGFTSAYTRNQLFDQLNGKTVGACIILRYDPKSDKEQFRRLIFTHVFNKPTTVTFKKLCSYTDDSHECVNLNHYEFNAQ